MSIVEKTLQFHLSGFDEELLNYLISIVEEMTLDEKVWIVCFHIQNLYVIFNSALAKHCKMRLVLFF
jgi:hypothetical protein